MQIIMALESFNINSIDAANSKLKTSFIKLSLYLFNTFYYMYTSSLIFFIASFCFFLPFSCAYLFLHFEWREEKKKYIKLFILCPFFTGI
jgi:hypothetical protein